MKDIPRLRGLLLAGGESIRMGSPKHVLPFTDGRPIYMHLLTQLRDSSPEMAGLSVSLHSAKDTEALKSGVGFDFDIICDADNNDGDARIGPAAGLLAAYHHDPAAHWLVLGCDYALIESVHLKQLLQEFEEPVTCFRNRDGYSEPLVGIWSPPALKHLEQNVKKGMTGPNRVIKELGGKTMRPVDDRALFNANTNTDWSEALRLASSA